MKIKIRNKTFIERGCKTTKERLGVLNIAVMVEENMKKSASALTSRKHSLVKTCTSNVPANIKFGQEVTA